MTGAQLEKLRRDLRRRSFLLDMREKLLLVRRGLIRDPAGVRERGLVSLIERHS